MPPESTPIADLYRLTQEIGYKVREVGLGAKYIDIHGKTQEITRDNSCRIGKGNVLYVGVYEPGSPYDRSDLCHDVGACLTGGKIIKKDCVPYIRINTFNQVTQLSAGKTFSLGELSEKNLLDPNDNTRIPDTYIFDAILAGDIEASMISSSSRVR
ncbi:hypothetical protein A2394_01445 [Candidatus Woesebacteria bacterium RIFOXYB1_FULL_42_36]|nr:MAG: hypothetical protein A2208_00420 [Candidatus Woesebacteria bacterium RIFOXYA1_FULL_43_16]OGM83301.1 MAG: hypothetical protein A2394_01445 [Candidatus Woesebacteria bacterium RIFOXYB1_FULL_42_36]OGM84219.1 MAG: hypothetical protein A2421_01235 [Candidatus Woesebacteria bacterium RIFOXYC1_FULL_43_18]OGM88634.1 MAG: hypothetical protein A2573_03445 [Candidatus Woesebacteria bacterium RIFOXYD1_FULL_43_18]